MADQAIPAVSIPVSTPAVAIPASTKPSCEDSRAVLTSDAFAKRFPTGCSTLDPVAANERAYSDARIFNEICKGGRPQVPAGASDFAALLIQTSGCDPTYTEVIAFELLNTNRNPGYIVDVPTLYMANTLPIFPWLNSN